MKSDESKMLHLEEIYENLAVLGKPQKNNEVFLSKNRENGRIVVKKYVDVSVVPVYEKISTLKDRHLERIYDYAQDNEKGIVITEFISGVTLTEYMSQSGALSEHVACNMIGDLLQALSKIHAAGIVHRDINPDNIMISNDGVLKLIDFGIARKKKVEQNQDTTILGTVGYAAPEQFGFFQTDERTDIYAVGVLLNKMLTGTFPGERMYQRKKLKPLIERCIAIDARERFESVEKLLEELQAISGEKKTNAFPAEEVFSVWWLPGFRTGENWRYVVATVGYIIMSVFTISSMVQFGQTFLAGILEAAALFMYIWAATLLAANVADWDRRIWPFKLLPKAAMIVIRVFLWIILFYFGVLLEEYVKYSILGLPMNKT